MNKITLNTKIDEAQWAIIINQVENQFLPKLIQPKIDLEEKCVYDPDRHDYFIEKFENGKFLAYFGKTGCATCGDGRTEHIRSFDSKEQLHGFITNSNLRYQISQTVLDWIMQRYSPKNIVVCENEVLVEITAAMFLFFLFGSEDFEVIIPNPFKRFHLHSDEKNKYIQFVSDTNLLICKLSKFSSMPNVQNYIKQANIWIEEAQKEIEIIKEEVQKSDLKLKYTKELIAWVNQNISAIETEVKKLVPQLQSKVRNENPKLYPNKQAEIFAAKYIDFCFLEAVDIVWNKQINEPIVWENTLSASYISVWGEIQSTYFIQRFSNSQKQKLFSTNVENW